MTEHRVYGPPGTGKTTYLTAQIARAAEQYGDERVLVCSFTRAAAAEIASRADLPEANVGTIHALAWRMAGRPDLADTAKYIKQWNQAHQAYRLSGAANNEDDPAQQGPAPGDALLAQYNRMRATFQSRAPWTGVARFAAVWEKWKEEQHLADFTDCLEKALAIGIPPGAPSIIFLDEAQDCTPLQWRLVRSWAEYAKILVVAGDDDQILYEHLGADVGPFMDGTPDFELVLPQSYRLPATVHAWSQRWLARHPYTRIEKEFRPREFPGAVSEMNATYRSPTMLAQDVSDQALLGQTSMILGTCGYHLWPIIKELKDLGIPFHNPYNTKRGDWNPLGTETGAARRVLNFLGDEDRWWSVGELHSWSAKLYVDGVMTHGAKTQIARLKEENPDRLVSVEEIDEWFVDPDAPKSGDVEWLVDHTVKDRQKALAYPLRILQKYGRERLGEQPRVVVGTIHSVKGGEADAVYLFPDLSTQGMKQWTAGNTAPITRQFYVGATRARTELVLMAPHSRQAVTL
jgi:DNA helicase-2/ATP-dependent DNA helicase PcrA|tara:strand:+ start:7572 stop:9122 length:1551 start_codon:yes stop_codon:yes gene_type:complete